MLSSLVSGLTFTLLIVLLGPVKPSLGGLSRITGLNGWLKVACIAENIKVRVEVIQKTCEGKKYLCLNNRILDVSQFP